MKNYLIWDFDGTLAYRLGGWTGVLLEGMHREATTCEATADQLRPHLQAGFRRHTPEPLIRASPPRSSGGVFWTLSLDGLLQPSALMRNQPSAWPNRCAKSILIPPAGGCSMIPSQGLIGCRGRAGPRSSCRITCPSCQPSLITCTLDHTSVIASILPRRAMRNRLRRLFVKHLPHLVRSTRNFDA